MAEMQYYANLIFHGINYATNNSKQVLKKKHDGFCPSTNHGYQKVFAFIRTPLLMVLNKTSDKRMHQFDFLKILPHRVETAQWRIVKSTVAL
jgi:hypothetical protein